MLAHALVERGDDPLDGGPLVAGQAGRLGLATQRLPGRGRRPLAPRGAAHRRDELERPRGRRAVVVGDPEREVDERGRDLVEELPGGDRDDPRGGSTPTSATTARVELRPSLTETTAPFRVPSGTEYVNGFVRERVETSGYTDASGTRRA